MRNSFAPLCLVQLHGQTCRTVYRPKSMNLNLDAFTISLSLVGTARDAIAMQKICCQGNRGEREREGLRCPLNTRTAAAAVARNAPPCQRRYRGFVCVNVALYTCECRLCLLQTSKQSFISASVCRSVTPENGARFTSSISFRASPSSSPPVPLSGLLPLFFFDCLCLNIDTCFSPSSLFLCTPVSSLILSPSVKPLYRHSHN